VKELASAVEFDIVVAADLGDGIGRRGAIPWRLPSDLAHLKRLTSETAVPGTRNAVLMGRVTWDTLPPRWQPLPRRLNLVITRQPHLAVPDGVLVAHSLEEALVSARQAADVERLFVLGGGEIYRRAVELPGCRHIYLTRVLARHECDAFFPPLPSTFGRDALLAEGADGEIGYRIERWSRSRAVPKPTS
jgi:dihydrofolate reductase